MATAAGMMASGVRASTRIAVAGAVGAAAAAATAAAGGGPYATTAGWVAAAAVYLAWNWAFVLTMDAGETASHATREDPTRIASDVLVLLASTASLAGVMVLLAQGGSRGGARDVGAGLGLCSVAASWLVVHTTYTLRYAKLYYSGTTGGIGFDQDTPPRYRDFAYLAFTVGMTYQVADTAPRTSEVRATILRQALLSYLLGAVVLAATINLVVSLGTSPS